MDPIIKTFSEEIIAGPSRLHTRLSGPMVWHPAQALTVLRGCAMIHEDMKTCVRYTVGSWHCPSMMMR